MGYGDRAVNWVALLPALPLVVALFFFVSAIFHSLRRNPNDSDMEKLFREMRHLRNIAITRGLEQRIGNDYDWLMYHLQLSMLTGDDQIPRMPSVPWGIDWPPKDEERTV